MSKINGNAFRFAILLGLCAPLLFSLLLSSYSSHPRQSPADFVIERDLELRLQPFSHGTLRVTVAQGVVKLDGRVKSGYDHEQVLAITKEGAGTNRVVDGLAVPAADAHAQDTDERYSAWVHARHLGTASSVRRENGE